MTFTQLGLAEPLLRSLAHEKYEVPTPIQAQAIPPIMAGHDLLGSAQTGTGKTAAFALPILHRFFSKTPGGPATRPAGARGVRCLVLAPTRELAIQIDESFRVYGRNLTLKHAVVLGGVSQHGQAHAISRGVDVLVATPGRLLDLVNQRIVDLQGVEVLVLDEADRMLDMGFINDIRKIIARTSPQRQTLMFSATMPNEIRKLAESILKNPIRIEVAPTATTVDKIDQSVYMVERKNKPALLAHLINHTAISRALVFTRTKHGADRVVRGLHKSGIKAEAIHGNKSQNARQRALDGFKAGKTPVLVATDIASRGIDVDDISHVFNYDLTHEPETYVHRIGRTARAGAEGHAVSFCDVDERSNLKAIERLIRKTIRVNAEQPKYEPVVKDHDGHERDFDRGDRGDRGARRGRDNGEKRREPQHATGRGVRSAGSSHAAHAAHSPKQTDGHRSAAAHAAHSPKPTDGHRSAAAHTAHAPKQTDGHRSAAPQERKPQFDAGHRKSTASSHGHGGSRPQQHGARPSHSAHAAHPSQPSRHPTQSHQAGSSRPQHSQHAPRSASPQAQSQQPNQPRSQHSARPQHPSRPKHPLDRRGAAQYTKRYAKH